MLRFALLGAGSIARAMAHTLNNMGDDVQLYAVATRNSLERAQQFADFWHAEIAYGSYQEMLADDNVDIVYVNTPSGLHYGHAKMCLEAGKHVLCEKSFTTDVAQAQELFDLACAKGLFIMEAVWTRFMPYVPVLQGIISSGVLGQVKHIESYFCTDHRDSARHNSPELGGGALWDLGIYNITFSRLMLGANVVAEQTEAIIAHGVDVENTTTWTYASGATSFMQSSLQEAGRTDAVITLEHGSIHVPNFWFCTHFVVSRDGQPDIVYDMPHMIVGYEYEVAECVKCIASGEVESALMSHSETMAMMNIMADMRTKWGL